MNGKVFGLRLYLVVYDINPLDGLNLSFKGFDINDVRLTFTISSVIKVRQVR